MKHKRIISFLLSGLMLFSLCGYFPNKKGISDLPLTADAANVENIVARADYLYGIKWTPKKSILTFEGKTFSAGKSYRLPYGMPVTPMGFIGYDISVDDFIKETKNSNSKLYSNYSYHDGMRSPYYSMDCSTFVSWCWGLSSRQTTYGLPNYSENIGACTSSSVSKIQVGDALNDIDSHVRLVTGISDGKYEITEMTPDVLLRQTFTKSQLASYCSGYDILRPTKFKTNTVKINYHTNGGTIGNDEYYAKDGKIYNSEDKVVGEKWEYGKGDSTGLFNASTFKLTKKGYTFTGWSTSKSGGKVFDQDDTSLTANDIYPDIATKSGTVVMYAQWKKNTLTINYNTNGGTIATNDTYYAKDSMIYNKTKEALAKQTWYYGSGGEDGLINASTFKLSRKGYTFTGWSTSKSGGTVFKQDDTSLTANDIYPDIATKSGTVTMYAQWKENTVTINYNINDGKISIDSKYYVESNGNIYEREDMTSYSPKWSYTYKPQYGLTDASTFKISREGYTFKGWSTSKSGGKIYDQSDNSLTAIDIFPDITTKSGTVTMYAQWELNLLTMNYNTNGGQISENDTYYAENNGNIYKKSDNTIFSVKWGYSYEAEKGLYNASTFNLSRPGYEFLGWSLSETGGTIYSQSDNTIRAATLFPDIYTKSGKVMLYAQWKKKEMIGDVNADGEFNVADVVLLEKWLLGASDITLGDWQAADLYKDDRLDVFDLCLMKQELLKVS